MSMPASADRDPADRQPAHTGPDHDELLIARLAADDLADPEAAAARSLVAGCPACAELHADLRSVMAAIAALPAPRRTRDFRVSEADTVRLRPAGWRRLLGRLREPRLAFTRPLATGLVTLGIAGLVVSAAPSFIASAGLAPSTASSGAEAPVTATNQGAGGVEVFGPAQSPLVAPDRVTPPPAPMAAGSSQPAASAPPPASARPEPSGGPPVGLVASPAGSGGVAVPPGGDDLGKSASGPGVPGAGGSPVVMGSLVLLVLGLGLFVLRWAARRSA